MKAGFGLRYHQGPAQGPIAQRASDHDLDCNGVPDWCVSREDGSMECLHDGTWVKVPNVPVHTSKSVLTTTTSTVPSSSIISSVFSTTTVRTRPLTIASVSTVTTVPTSPSPVPNKPVAEAAISLPEPDEFKQDKGLKWNIEYVGDILYTGALAAQNVNGDKCRSSKLGDKIIWNCGDMMCGSDVSICGFSMGPAFYGTDSVMTINTDGISNVNENEFLGPWIGDAVPVPPQKHWGMDTSNVAAINNTHGVAYAWEIWRGDSDQPISDRGNAVASVTLGADRPIAQRVGPLLTGPDSVQLGLLAILRDQNYIYIYSVGGPSKLLVSRVLASDDVFDPNKYESLQHGTSTWATGIPKITDTQYGMQTANKDGQFGCAVYGSVFYNNYLNKYTIVCSIFQSYVNMYTSDTPFGPWSGEYSLLSGWTGYGSMVHPDYSPGGSHKEIYFSQGPNTKFNMFKVTFNY